MTSPIEELSPETVQERLRAGGAVLVDVREPEEFAAERIEGAVLFPLSTFDPASLPAPAESPVIFQCGSGKRSAMAVALCRQRGLAHSAHLAGGIQAWKAAGLPTIRG